MTSHIELTSKKDIQNAAISSMVLRIIRNTFDINLMSSPGQQQWMECQAGAILDGVIGAEFTGALNVPERYLKD